MPKLQDELDEFHEAGRDLGYAIFKASGMIALVRKLGMTPKAWIREREQRDLEVSLSPELKAKRDQAARDIAASPHGGISLEEAQRRMARKP